jgi:hypothetical protein
MLLAVFGLANFGGIVAFGDTVGLVAVLVGAILVGTALTRMCLIYRLVGVDTCRTR